MARSSDRPPRSWRYRLTLAATAVVLAAGTAGMSAPAFADGGVAARQRPAATAAPAAPAAPGARPGARPNPRPAARPGPRTAARPVSRPSGRRATAPVAAQAGSVVGGGLQVPVEPRIEDIDDEAANQPYRLRGRLHAAHDRDEPMVQVGQASWYGHGFHGRRTASGERFDRHGFTAAHPTMPLPSWAVVENPANGRRIVVRVNDRGPFKASRIIDLSQAAARALDIDGVATVRVERLTHDDIRTGAWRRRLEPDADATAVADAATRHGTMPIDAGETPMPSPADGPAAPAAAGDDTTSAQPPG